MKGDKLVIEEHHTGRANDCCDFLADKLFNQFVISIAGESGSGKSELAFELSRLLTERKHPSGILGQDDYFVFPPQTNHEMRRNNIHQVGPYEVKLDFLDSNLRSYKRGESPIYKPLVIYEEDHITHEELDTSNLRILIAEGTYTSLLVFVDFRIFIDRDYHQTLDIRRRRGRDTFEPFIEEVLEREHQIISLHKDFADVIIPPDFGSIKPN